jgi:YidC/Oxa1 family membrane protein insertase
MDEIRNLIMAVALSVGVLIAWHFLSPAPQPAPFAQNPAQEASVSIPTNNTLVDVTKLQTTDDVVTTTKRVTINGTKLSGSIALKGARFDDISLNDYHEKIAQDSANVKLLKPIGTDNPYFAEFGWVSSNSNITLPTRNTLWNNSKETIANGELLTLYWVSPQNVTFIIEATLSDDYIFNIKQIVKNNSNYNFDIRTYGLLNREYYKEHQAYLILHEGPLAKIDDKLVEHSFGDVQDERNITYSDASGWMAITDKYWLTSIIPDKNQKINVNFKFYQKDGHDKYQADFTSEPTNLASGSVFQTNNYLFTGAKKVGLLDDYSKKYNIDLFDRTVDFGVLYFLTKPMFLALKFFNHLLGNFGLAIIALTICIRIILFPLANKSFRAIGKMKDLHPKITQIREQHKGDKANLNKAIMQLYRENKVNPAAGCLPVLVQIPIFFALYKVLFITIEMRQAPFYGWIKDLSIPDPTSIFNLFGLFPWAPYFGIGVWPILMGITMVLQQKLNPPPADPIQAKVMQYLPYIFVFLFASFPAGLIIYWTCNNTLSVLQQWLITRSSKNGQTK